MPTIDEEVKGKRGELLSLLKKLVAIRTDVPPGENYNEIIDFLIPKFEAFGFKCEKVEMPQEVYETRQKQEGLRGERVNLVARRDAKSGAGAKERLTVYTHLDVVPAGSGWHTDPFEATVRDDKVYGRGVADSKGAVACLLTALSVAETLELEQKRDLEVVLTTDEEVGPYSGLCYLADAGFLTGKYFLCMDGDNDGVCVATNGIIVWEAEIFGKSCHSSYSFIGENAIEKANLLLNELMQLKGTIEQRTSKMPCSPFLRELTGIERMRAVFNVTMMNAGVKENVIPERCELRGDRRYLPEEPLEEVLHELEEHFKRATEKHGIRARWEFKPMYPPMFTDPNDSFVEEVRRNASAAFRREMEIIGVQGSLDVAYAVKKTKQKACAFGVGRSVESNAHAPDENVRIDDLLNYTKFLMLSLFNLD
ncbi:MAG: Acetylornithine deacetylase/Succinyl-diaminopimelate desuccinylase or related deacylase [Candidatus Alkanophagales archaeon MCA70_species_1]|nr:Acetylornithine deacetylase/Succinyl-diaminopimelate desuccinylase or related deacylase [Candidatus Alkanophaga volatiphilum]